MLINISRSAKSTGLATLDSRQAQTNRNASLTRNRSLSENIRDIGDIPRIVNPERRRATSRSFKLFMETYYTNFDLPWCDDHLKVISMVESAVWEGGLSAIALPRASGKTSILSCAAEFGILHGFQPFIVLIANDANAAGLLLLNIRTDFEVNPGFLEDFPEVVFPIRALENIQRRCPGQTHHGRNTRSMLNPKFMILPTITPEWDDPNGEFSDFLRPDGTSLASGSVIRVAGITGSIRGLLQKKADGTSIRPTMVIVDDPQTNASSKSPVQCATREKVLSGAVLGLAGPGKKVAGLMACTVITQGDMADSILDRKKHPAWQGMRAKMIYDWPNRMDLWDQYRNLRIEGQQREEGVSTCNEFYYDNWDAMHEGAHVAWPERFNWDEYDGLQHAINLWIDRGEVAFQSEYQSEPLSELTASPDDVTSDQVIRKINRHPRGIVPLGCEYITAGVDVMKSLLYWSVVAWMPDFTGHVIAYGTWPDQKQLYFTLSQVRLPISRVVRCPDLEGQIYQSMEALVTQLMETEWLRDDQTVFKISKMLVDANWGLSTNTIYKWIRQSKYAGLVLPSHGKYLGASSNPMSQWQKHQGDKVGLNWRIRSMEGRRAVRSVLFDSNWWKSFLHNRLRVPMGSKSCLSFYGDKPEIHRMWADQLSMSEYRVQVEAKTSGRTVEEWKARPERVVENHALDVLTLACVSASIVGCKIEESGQRVEEERKRVSFKGLQEKKVAPAVRSNRVSFKDLQQKNQNPPPR